MFWRKKSLDLNALENHGMIDLMTKHFDSFERWNYVRNKFVLWQMWIRR